MSTAQITDRIAYEMQNPSDKPDFLDGKFSQAFVDEIVDRMSDAIARACSVEGLAESGIVLRFAFLPGTSMEHTSENVTYRRLQLTTKGCAPRDFWVKWTRKNSSSAYSLSDEIDPDGVEIELGEDVPQKFREREFRYLAMTDSEKYASSTAKRAVTEWRDLINRAVKKGMLRKIETVVEEKDSSDISDALSALLAKYAPAATAPAEPTPLTEEPAPFAPLDELLAKEDEKAELPDWPEILDAEPEAELEEIEETVDEAAEEVAEDIYEVAKVEDEKAAEEPDEELTEDESAFFEEEIAEETPETPELPDEDAIRRDIEAKLRAEYEEKLRLASEAEATRARESELLREDNRRLAEAAKAAEAARLAKAAEEKQRVQAANEEKARIAEAAKAAIEARRLAEAEEAEKARQARLAKEAEERANAERAAKAAEARAAKEAELRAAREARENRSEGNGRKSTHIVRLIFRHPIDPNVVGRIREIIGVTLEYYHKEKMYLRVQATLPDSGTVVLTFLDFPDAERELLINIIKVLGNSDIGVSKITLD